ncbi:MAG: NUDIX domain-containing protein [Roseiflexaceae bacterium]
MRWFEQQLLGPIYRVAVRLRRRYWSLARPTLVGVRVLAVRGDEVLLVRHRSGTAPWSLPGGGVERYERLVEAAQREVYEEAGVHIRNAGLLGVYDNFHSGTSNYVAVFVADPLGEPRPPRSLEIAEARFFPLDALPTGLERGSRRRIDEWRSGGAGLSRLW